MTIFQAIILGIVQGLCEFLPVSSSGHLVLLQNLFGLNEGALFFDTMLHVATLLAVVIVYRKTIWAIIKHPIDKLFGYLIIATLPTVVVALLFRDFFESSYSGAYLGWGFLITAVVLSLPELVVKKNDKELGKMRPQHAVFMGVMQAVAIMPGISRSGSTIAGGLFCGLDRKFAADFSFLMSIPAILGSLVLQIPDVVRSGLDSVDWGTTLIAMVFAFGAGYAAIRCMLRIIKKGKLRYFALYVGVLGLLVVIDTYFTHFCF